MIPSISQIEMMILLNALCNSQGARGGWPRPGAEPWAPDAAVFSRGPVQAGLICLSS